MICFSFDHCAPQISSTRENRAVRGWTKDQPHAIAHVLQPTLWGENQKRDRRQSLAMPNGWCRMHGDLRLALRGAISSSARYGRRCGAGSLASFSAMQRHVRRWRWTGSGPTTVKTTRIDPKETLQQSAVTQTPLCEEEGRQLRRPSIRHAGRSTSY
jgi:hypothetical protein